MFSDFVCFQIYFQDYVAQSCFQNGTAYICFSIMDCHEMRRDTFLSSAHLSVYKKSHFVYICCGVFAVKTYLYANACYVPVKSQINHLDTFNKIC